MSYFGQVNHVKLRRGVTIEKRGESVREFVAGETVTVDETTLLELMRLKAVDEIKCENAPIQRSAPIHGW